MILTNSDWFEMKEKLEVLFHESFGRSIPAGYLDWRYFKNNSDKLLFAVEVIDGVLVASYSAFPVDLMCEGKTYQTSMSMTTMTHPRWRGKGLFQQLAGELYLNADALQTKAIWGFPNSSSHPIFNEKLLWSDIYEIPTMTLDLLYITADKFTLSADVLRDDDFSLVYDCLLNDGLIQVHRTRGYLTWRYAQNPVNSYQNFVIARDGRVSSYVVTKSYENGVDLVDIQIANLKEARALLEHIAKLNLNGGVHHLSCWSMTHHSVHGVLERMGFVNADPITYFGGRELISSTMPPGWLNYKNWYIQMGDSDVY